MGPQQGSDPFLVAPGDMSILLLNVEESNKLVAVWNTIAVVGRSGMTSCFFRVYHCWYPFFMSYVMQWCLRSPCLCRLFLEIMLLPVLDPG